MGDKEVNVLAGFEQVYDYMSNPVKGNSDFSDYHSNNEPAGEYIDPDELEKRSKTASKPSTKKKEDVDDLEDKEIEEEEIEDVEEEEVEDIEDDEDDDEEDIQKSNKSVSDVDDDEGEIVSDFVDLFTGELGWKLDDEEKPKDIKELVNFMATIIEENSTPTYANEEIKKLDEYAKNGGNIYEYLDKFGSKKLTLESIDLEEESNQRNVVKEYLKTLNYSDDKINKRILRYEEAGTLEEEAEEALELLKEHNKKLEEKLLQEQKTIKEVHIAEQQKFINNVQSVINDLDAIQGIPLSKKDKKDLIDYLFKVESDGKTAYQKDYSKNNMNLIESAYFTKNGGKAYTKVRAKAESDAVLKFKQNLKSKRKPKQEKPYESGHASFSDAISAISKVLS